MPNPNNNYKSQKAKGIPDRSNYGDLSKLEAGQLLDYFLQEHRALRAGLHDDLRFGTKKDGLYSWAVPKGLPKPNDNPVLAVQTNLHKHSYGKWEGTIPRGQYGGGTVTSKDIGKVLIDKAQPDQISFTVAHKKYPERYSLIKPQGGYFKDWLLRNTTPTEPIPYVKQRYNSIPQEKAEEALENLPSGSTVQPKIDGACFPPHMLVLTEKGWISIGEIVNKRLPISVYSYENNNITLKKINNYWKNPKPDTLIKLRSWTYPRAASYVTCTPNHEIYTPTGKIRAENLKLGDEVLVKTKILNADQQQVLIGCLIGAGCITKNGKFSVSRTSNGGKAYLDWMSTVFNEITYTHKGYICGKSKHFQHKFSTRSMFYNIREEWYINGQKTIPRTLTQLSPLALAVLFQGDGATGRKNGRISFSVLCLDDFNLPDLNLLQNIVNKYGITSKIIQKGLRIHDNKPRYQLWFNRTETIKLFKLIAPYVHPSMSYKLKDGCSKGLKKKPEIFSVGTKLPYVNSKILDGVAASKIDMLTKVSSNIGKPACTKFVYDLEVEGTHNYFVNDLLVSNSTLIKLLADKPEIASYRVSKTDGRPIIHTERVFNKFPQVDIPKNLHGSVLRGELYGENKSTGKTIPPQALGAILNSSVANAIKSKHEKNIVLKNLLFDIQQKGSSTISKDIPYTQRLAMIKEIHKHLPSDTFTLPEEAKNPEEALRLFKSIRSGKHPLTHEGVIIHPDSGKPSKIKFNSEHDVLFHSIFPGEGKYKDIGAGGFNYQLHKDGPVIGKVGTGFNDELRRELLQNANSYSGRTVRIKAQEQLPSGAFRAPVFKAFHEDYPNVNSETPPELEKVSEDLDIEPESKPKQDLKNTLDTIQSNTGIDMSKVPVLTGDTKRVLDNVNRYLIPKSFNQIPRTVGNWLNPVKGIREIKREHDDPNGNYYHKDLGIVSATDPVKPITLAHEIGHYNDLSLGKGQYPFSFWNPLKSYKKSPYSNILTSELNANLFARKALPKDYKNNNKFISTALASYLYTHGSTMRKPSIKELLNKIDRYKANPDWKTTLSDSIKSEDPQVRREALRGALNDVALKANLKNKSAHPPVTETPKGQLIWDDPESKDMINIAKILLDSEASRKSMSRPI